MTFGLFAIVSEDSMNRVERLVVVGNLEGAFQIILFGPINIFDVIMHRCIIAFACPYG
jgi:hypothetical protein